MRDCAGTVLRQGRDSEGTVCRQCWDSAGSAITIWRLQGYCRESGEIVWGQCGDRVGTIENTVETRLGMCADSVGTVLAQC